MGSGKSRHSLRGPTVLVIALLLMCGSSITTAQTDAHGTESVRNGAGEFSSESPHPVTAATAASAGSSILRSTRWVDGKHYFELGAERTRNRAGGIQVTEVFSYACRGCYMLYEAEGELSTWLPKGATARYLPVAFGGAHGFSLYQRAFLAAQALGVPSVAHPAIFTFAWGDGTPARKHERAVTLRDISGVYARFGLDTHKFVNEARSGAINKQMKAADKLAGSYGVTSLPTIIVAGRYRLDPASAGGHAEAVQLTRWLVAKVAAERTSSP